MNMKPCNTRDKDGKPVFELAGKVLNFPIAVEADGEEYLLTFQMSPYTPSELKPILQAMNPALKMGGGPTVRTEPADASIGNALVDAHLQNIIGMVGADDQPLPIDRQRSWLDENLNVKARVFTEGFGGMKMVQADGGRAAGPLRISDDFGTNSTSRVKVYQKFFNAEAQVEETVNLVHVLRGATRADHQRYTKATAASDWNTRQQTWQRVENQDAIEKLYDEMIIQLEGATIEGAACGAGNSALWIPMVPLWYKLQAMDEVFRAVKVKN